MSAVPDEVLKYVADSKDDSDPQETAEWLEALDGVISAVGPNRAHYLIEKQIVAVERQECVGLEIVQLAHAVQIAHDFSRH